MSYPWKKKIENEGAFLKWIMREALREVTVDRDQACLALAVERGRIEEERKLQDQGPWPEWDLWGSHRGRGGLSRAGWGT